MAGGAIMSNTHTMVDLAQQYLDSRRKLGFALTVQGKELLLFARYCDQTGHEGPITTELAIRWARLPCEADPHYWAKRLDTVRRFARYRALFDPATEIPPKGILGPTKHRPTPHIYSTKEIGDLLRAAAQIGPPAILRPHTFSTLFGLLACTGIRVSEALRLTRENVDLDNAVITIERTKFHKSRMIPIHPSTVYALEKYWQKRLRVCPLAGNDTLFINDRCLPINYRKVLWVFMQIRKKLGWRRNAEGRFPTIHCLRHTFAVRCLLHWYEQGADVNRKILSLSTYLGHVEVTDTYWYLTAVPQLLSLCSARFAKFVNQQGEKV